MTDRTAKDILAVLDASADAFVLPMLDNGYVYPAAARLSLWNGPEHWAMVFETFGYSPRAYLPHLQVTTIASTITNRTPAGKFVSPEAHAAYLARDPNWEQDFLGIVEGEDWLDSEEPELIVPGMSLMLRGVPRTMPPTKAFADQGITLSEDRPAVFEVIRYLAETERDLVLATPEERRTHLPNDVRCLAVLDDWPHPDLANGVVPAEHAGMQQIARAVATGDVGFLEGLAPGNTHWSNWPLGGTL